MIANLRNDDSKFHEQLIKYDAPLANLLALYLCQTRFSTETKIAHEKKTLTQICRAIIQS